MTLLVVAASLLNIAGLGWVALAADFVPPFHFYRQLKGTYLLSRFGALWRTAALTFMSTVALSIFALLMVLLGVL